MTRRSSVPPGAWPQHYTADDIAVAKAVKQARTDRGLSLADIARMIGCSPSPVCQVLAGTYKDQPARLLNRMAAALELPRPASWAHFPAPMPAATSVPMQAPAPAAAAPRKPSRPRYGCREPGEGQSNADTLVQAAILHALATTSSACPLAVPELLKQLAKAGVRAASARPALGQLIDACEVMRATVVLQRRRLEVVYLMGRTPGKALQRRRVQITPSNHANSVHKGSFA